MHPIAARAAREIYRRELVPIRARWWMAAEGMRQWFRTVARGLEAHLGGRKQARAVIADIGARMFQRRGEALTVAGIPSRDPRTSALRMAGLYRIWTDPRAAWIFDCVGGAPRGPIETARAITLARELPVAARWREVATHLGELLIVLTDELPKHIPHARKVLGDLCFDMGVHYGTHTKRALGVGSDDPAADAIEVLRMSELIFHVNPEHQSETDMAQRTGSLEGSACLWYPRPGWNGAHCGIFGQFQSGVSSVFGLRYVLAKTIPRHGGGTCRVDLKPIALRKGKDGPVV